MKNNKKGQDTVFPPLVLLSVVLVLVVLVIVLVSIGKINLPQWVDNLIPNFAAGNKTVEGVQVVRYRITEGNMQYYDGENWIDVGDGEAVILDDKEVEENSLEESFRNYYYDVESRDDSKRVIQLEIDSRDRFYPNDEDIRNRMNLNQ